MKRIAEALAAVEKCKTTGENGMYNFGLNEALRAIKGVGDD